MLVSLSLFQGGAHSVRLDHFLCALLQCGCYTALLSSPRARKFQAQSKGKIWPFEMIQEVPDTAWYERQEASLNLKQHLHFLMLHLVNGNKVIAGSGFVF